MTKKLFYGEGIGRVIVINLSRGDRLLEGIRDRLKEEGIKNAVLFGAVGSMQKLVYHLPTSMGPTSEDKFLTIEGNGPIELGSLSGNVIDGDPHLHIVAQDKEGTYIGHLEAGTEILFLGEIILAEINNLNIHRVKNESGVVYLTEK
ncbi:PPC domain-containing DNA-binding protein [Metabacillus halosaccharovorans]|uniref:PPC domain-containing DNA-binding protein n=1 Tax=Metabacillus halosaccharovorans TaxID=930124 RepID=UPI002041D4AB|nr:PPC domain-containing DNA-binding protein [Metabacillus halosaccharovorans]MCM3439374.1 DNA-binding protein [Metabacillus halosaccharovorans]